MRDRWRQLVQRREFITLLAGAALIGPSTAIAQTQTPKVYRLGTLAAGAPMLPDNADAAVLIGALTQRGYTLNQNLIYEARGADGKLSQMRQQMQELKRANVDVVVTVSYPAAVIAKSSGIATVIATGSGDPLTSALVNSLARPGGNVTGISDVAATLSTKRLSLLRSCWACNCAGSQCCGIRVTVACRCATRHRRWLRASLGSSSSHWAWPSRTI